MRREGKRYCDKSLRFLSVFARTHLSAHEEGQDKQRKRQGQRGPPTGSVPRGILVQNGMPGVPPTWEDSPSPDRRPARISGGGPGSSPAASESVLFLSLFLAGDRKKGGRRAGQTEAFLPSLTVAACVVARRGRSGLNSQIKSKLRLAN